MFFADQFSSLIVTLSITAPSELSRMYPTPPSHETNPDCSPLTLHEAHMDTSHPTVVDSVAMMISVKHEVTVGNTLTDDLNKVRGLFPF